jgi:hypothetical protein
VSTTIPTLPTAPAVNRFATRIFDRLPESYRSFDANAGYPFLLYIDAITQELGAIDTVIDRITGQRPVGPAQPEPWSLHPSALADYRANRVLRLSELADPLAADAAWLPWLVQMVGGALDPAASVAEQRDTVRYATSGWLAGSVASIEYAARTALTGSQYAKCVPHMTDGGAPGGPWDVAIMTRSSETPDPSAVLGAITRKGVKPAGVILHLVNFGASWDILESARPTWDLWESDNLGVVTWDRLADTGLSYADVPGNLVPNASYEANVTGWTAGANTTVTWLAGGLDGLGQAIVHATAAGQVKLTSSTFAVTAAHDYRSACSVKPTATRTGRLIRTWSTGATATSPDFTAAAGVWTRVPFFVATAPTGATTASVAIQIDGMATAETIAVDAWDAREYHG